MLIRYSPSLAESYVTWAPDSRVNFCTFEKLRIGSDVIQGDLEPLLNHRAKAWRLDVEADRVDEWIKRRLIAMGLEGRVAQLHDNECMGRCRERVENLPEHHDRT